MSTTMIQTMASSTAVSQPSSCRLKMSLGAKAARSGGRSPAASFPARSFAAAKNPMRGSSLAIFWIAAVVVTVTSQASGTPGTQA